MGHVAPQEYEELTQLITREYNTLSNRLRKAATYALEHPTAMALDTIASIAQNAGVQPSALIRFAKAFGYSGFSELQRVYQRHVAAQSASYKERIQYVVSRGSASSECSTFDLLKQYCSANIVALEELPHAVNNSSLNKAINLISKAEQVYIMAQRRSFPIAAYLRYSLSHADCRAHLLDGSGGMLNEQAQCMTKNDLLIAISFHPYSSETIAVVNSANHIKMPFIAITDSKLSPIVTNAKLPFIVHDAEVHSFRSLSASLCLAQTIVTGLALRNTAGVKT